MDGIDLTDLERFAGGFPYEVFDLLRREAPVWFHEPTAHTPDGEGLMDDPRHAVFRRLLRPSVSPRTPGLIEEDLAERVASVELPGPVEFVRRKAHRCTSDGRPAETSCDWRTKYYSLV